MATTVQLSQRIVVDIVWLFRFCKHINHPLFKLCISTLVNHYTQIEIHIKCIIDNNFGCTNTHQW